MKKEICGLKNSILKISFCGTATKVSYHSAPANVQYGTNRFFIVDLPLHGLSTVLGHFLFHLF